MVVLNRKFILRYLILAAVLVVCAGAAWYLTNASKVPSEDAVLAWASEREEDRGRTEGLHVSLNPVNHVKSEGEVFCDGE